MTSFRTLDDVDVAGKRVLVRADLNVPVRDGQISDRSRIERLAPTIAELSAKGARVIVCSHFDRPKGEPVPGMSLAPMATALGNVLGKHVAFAHDCTGEAAIAAVAELQPGEVLVLENTRFHAGEETNDPTLARDLGALADIFVNDAFSAAHRAHASTQGVAKFLPAYAGRLMQAELEALDKALGHPERPVMAIVAGSKVSTKIELLSNLLDKVDILVIGGAMANTFLAARGLSIGKSLQEVDMHQIARDIMDRAEELGTEIILPTDGVIARVFKANPETETVAVTDVPADAMMLDVGPDTVALIVSKLREIKTLVWNGPLGAFETPPFDHATVALAKAVAKATRAGTLVSVAGGGDTVSALHHAGVAEGLSYVSSAGGAFLEWMEGKSLPGVAALESQ